MDRSTPTDVDDEPPVSDTGLVTSTVRNDLPVDGILDRLVHECHPCSRRSLVQQFARLIRSLYTRVDRSC